MLAQIQILLVEDDSVWIQGLSDFIHQEKDLVIAGVATTKEHAIQLVSSVPIDVVVLDIMLTENHLDGIDTALEISSLGNYKIIMFTSLTADEIIIDSFTAGAVNYINKLNYKELPDAIRAVFHNQSSIHTSAALALRNEIQRLKKEEMRRLISPTEKEILKLIDQGYTQSQIAKQMISAERTIKNHINRILRKLGVGSSKQAAQKAKKNSLF